MSLTVPALCTEIETGSASGVVSRLARPRPLAHFREARAYVLLGEPGSGKTTAFDEEARQCDGQVVSARDFLALNLDRHPEWRDTVLFIDGLDEARALSANPVRPFDQARRRLEQLSPPRFRISCRMSDWLFPSDQNHLNRIIPQEQVKLLRLEPLTARDIAQILRERLPDGESGLSRAQNLGIDGLLANPQLLDLFVRAMDRGREPRSRIEVFHEACRRLASEENEEHKIASHSGSGGFSVDEILQVAEELLSVQLLSGADGFSLTEADAGDGYLSPAVIHADTPRKALAVLKTKLFRTPSGNRTTIRVPFHQSVAEFLVARHISQAMNTGLSRGRILSLLTGGATGLPRVQRGLAGWLASFNCDVREDLIRRDPVSLLHGSLDEFTRTQKECLLSALRRRAAILVRESEAILPGAVAALGTADMELTLRAVLQHGGRSDEDQALAYVVLRGLQLGSFPHRLRDVLSDLMHDENRWPTSRVLALRIQTELHIKREDSAALATLLDDVANGQIIDVDRLLLGTLLTMLYPRHISPERIWDYLPGNRHSDLGTSEFWQLDFEWKTRDRHVPALLDQLHSRADDLCPRLQDLLFDDVVLRLVARGVQSHGDGQPIDRLYNWLSSAGRVYRPQDDESRDAAQPIRRWLEQRDEVLKAIILEGLGRPVDLSDTYNSYGRNVLDTLFGALVPDFGVWCLKQATSVGMRGRRAEILFEWAVSAHRSGEGCAGLSRNDLEVTARGHKPFREILKQMLPSPRAALQSVVGPSSAAREVLARVQSRLEAVRSEADNLHQNCAHPTVLHRLARAYFGSLWEHPESGGRDRLSAYLQHEEDLVEAALAGLRGVLVRADLPTSDEIVRLAAKENRIFWLSLPLMAGLAESARHSLHPGWEGNRALVRSALASYYQTAYQNQPPSWYRHLLSTCPGTVADVLLKHCRAMFRYRRMPSAETVSLLSQKGHSHVAREISLLLLRSFPLRCRRDDIRILDHLLSVALQVADIAALSTLVKTKLARTSMTVVQRGRWLIAGLIADPGAFKGQVREFTGEQPDRTAGIAEFARYEGLTRLHRGDQRLSLASVAIQVFGSWAGPEADEGSGWMGPESLAATHVQSLLRELLFSPDPEAERELCQLRSDPSLESWKNLIDQLCHQRRASTIDREYKFPTAQQVWDVLQDGPPANASDLMALLDECLATVRRRLRSLNSDPWCKYWNEDEHGRPQAAKREESCRDALLDDLRYVLPSGFATDPEAEYFNRGRADIRVTFGDLQVPIEIKKRSGRSATHHRECLRAQLVGKYANRSASEATVGYGVYIVLWFGRKTPQERPCDFQRELVRMLSAEERTKVRVHVLDVSAPSESSAAGSPDRPFGDARCSGNS